MVIHLLWQLNCGTDVLKDGPSALPPPLCCYFCRAMFPYWWHLTPWFVATSLMCEIIAQGCSSWNASKQGQNNNNDRKYKFNTMPRSANTSEHLIITTSPVIASLWKLIAILILFLHWQMLTNLRVASNRRRARHRSGTSHLADPRDQFFFHKWTKYCLSSSGNIQWDYLHSHPNSCSLLTET